MYDLEAQKKRYAEFKDSVCIHCEDFEEDCNGFFCGNVEMDITSEEMIKLSKCNKFRQCKESTCTGRYSNCCGCPHIEYNPPTYYDPEEVLFNGKYCDDFAESKFGCPEYFQEEFSDEPDI